MMIIPRSGIVSGDGSTIDSAGNYYFGQTDNILTKLVPSTDTFIQVSFLQPQKLVYHTLELSSSGEVFFMDRNFAGKVNFDTGDITTWRLLLSINAMVLDSNDNMYFVTNVDINEFLYRLNPNTSVLTSWFLNTNGNNAETLTIDNNDNIYIYQRGINARIQKVDTINNVLEEWVFPTLFSINARSMAADSAGTVYFLDDLTRLEPSTGKFTTWKVASRTSLAHVTLDSNDDLWIAGAGFFGKVTAAP